MVAGHRWSHNPHSTFISTLHIKNNDRVITARCIRPCGDFWSRGYAHIVTRTRTRGCTCVCQESLKHNCTVNIILFFYCALITKGNPREKGSRGFKDFSRNDVGKKEKLERKEREKEKKAKKSWCGAIIFLGDFTPEFSERSLVTSLPSLE